MAEACRSTMDGLRQACMFTASVNQLLTINIRDSHRFNDLRVTHPNQVTEAA